MSTETVKVTGPPPPKASDLSPDLVMSFDVAGPDGLARFLDLVPEPPGRIQYRKGRLTIVAPSFPHEHGTDSLDELVKMIGEELEIALDAAASTLYRRDDLDHGVMPDKSYYIEHQGALAGVETTVDLRVYPPPDLVIEVVWTHGASEALEILRAMGVPEVWVYDVPAANLQFLHLDPGASYVARPRSRAFPFLSPGEALAQIRSQEAGEPLHLWRRRLRAWVRDVLGPRRAGG